MFGGLRRTLMLVLVIGCAGAVSLSACQSYEFEQVTPVAIKPVTKVVDVVGKVETPFIMLVVDKSGSMLDSTEKGGSGCRDIYGVYQPGVPCKWTSLLVAFTDPATGFLSKAKQKNLAQVGLTVFPGSAAEGQSEDGCEMGDISVPLDPVADGIDASLAKLKAVEPTGGTPIAVTLRKVAQDPMLKKQDGVSRKRFVMLLTDGLPNCNPANAQRCLVCDGKPGAEDICQSKPDGCRPTYGPPDLCLMENPWPGADCLDDQHTVEAVRELKALGVDTFIIGFGLETAQGTDAAEILNAAAEAGGRPRSNSETKYFQAGTQAELEAILEDISQQLQPCSFQISPVPTSAGTVQLVILDKQDGSETELVQGEQWKFTNEGLNEIEFLNEQCTLISEAQPERYSLQFRYVSSM